MKIFDIYFCYLATNEKIAITHLWHAIEPQTMYHLIAKDKVAEQHISRKNCNTFGVMSPKVAKIAITHLSLGLSPQNQKNFQGHENPLGQFLSPQNQKNFQGHENSLGQFCSCSSFEEIWVTH